MDATLLLKATLLWSATLIASRLSRGAAASARHRLWSVAFASLLALPLLSSAIPPVHVPLPAVWRDSLPIPTTAPAAAGANTRTGSAPAQRPSRSGERVIADAAHSVPASAEPARVRFSFSGFRLSGFRLSSSVFPLVLIWVWPIGTAVAAAALLRSLIRVRRLARTAAAMDDSGWRHVSDACAARLGLRRPVRLLVSDAVRTPMAGGVWRPLIFLPASARTWSAERRDVVLAHELAHLAKQDPLRHLAARLTIALYWFHPLAWIAARESSVAREQACDEAVIALGTRPSTYARVLLDLADSLQPAAPALAALPMVERSLLETRLMAILKDRVTPASGRQLLLPAIGVALLTISVAAATPTIRSSISIDAPASAVPPTASLPPPAAIVPSVEAIKAADRIVAPQTNVDRDSVCWADPSYRSSFRGTTNTSESAGRIIINEQIGTRDGDRIIQTGAGNVRICMFAEGVGDAGSRERPGQWLAHARHVAMETRRGAAVHRLDVEAGRQVSWKVGGAERPFDAEAQRWRDRLLAVLDATWELSSLNGNVSSLRGEISSIHGEESSLRGEISSLRGEVSSMRGRASSVRGEESSLRGEISSIQGHVSSLRGQISSEQGAISSLNASAYGSDQSDRARIATGIERHNTEIARLEQALRDYNAAARIAAVEKEIQALDSDGKVAAIENEIRAFDLDAKVKAIEARIAALDVDGKTAAIERQIAALDAERRSRELRDRRDADLKALEAAIAAIR